MSSTDEQPETNEAGGSESESTSSVAERAAAARRKQAAGGGGMGRSVKRYGPFVAVLVLVIGAIVIFGGGGSIY